MDGKRSQTVGILISSLHLEMKDIQQGKSFPSFPSGFWILCSFSMHVNYKLAALLWCFYMSIEVFLISLLLSISSLLHFQLIHFLFPNSPPLKVFWALCCENFQTYQKVRMSGNNTQLESIVTFVWYKQSLHQLDCYEKDLSDIL